MIMKRDYESRIQKLLSQMTLEEKIGRCNSAGRPWWALLTSALKNFLI